LVVADRALGLPVFRALSLCTCCRQYRTNLTKNQLEKAPKYNQSTSWNWNRDNDLRVYDYYKTQPYWSAV
jgi:hypothetical protein